MQSFYILLSISQKSAEIYPVTVVFPKETELQNQYTKYFKYRNITGEENMSESKRSKTPP